MVLLLKPDILNRVKERERERENREKTFNLLNIFLGSFF